MRETDKQVFNSIIIVEDDKGLNRLIEKKLTNLGYSIISTFTGAEALSVIEKEDNVLLVSDYILTDMDASQLINKVLEINPKIPFIITTGRGDEQLAVEMMKKGALDYITKDTGFLNILLEVIHQAEHKIATERKLERTEKALKASEKNFRQIIHKSASGIFVRQDDRFVLANPSLVETVKYSKEELLDKNFQLEQLIHPDSRDKIKDLAKSYVQADYLNKSMEIKGISKEDKLLYFEVTLAQIEWNGKPALLGILNDITEFYNLKSEMIKAAKNESINILAGGLAHDFNNILSVVLGNLILLKSRLEKGQDTTELINSIEETIASGTGLTRQLLSFSKEEELDTDIISLRQLLKRTVRFTTSGSKVKVHYELQKDLAPIRADRHQIVQVITNLVINAKQAMKEGGDLYIKAQNVELDEAHQKKYLKEGRYVKVSLRDTGIGIPEKLQEKIFEAFFTTKSNGQGLGLATCLTILKRHNGWLEVDNHPEHGAIFTLYMPSINASIDSENKDNLAQHFTGKILIMDDMKDVRTALKYIFKDLGLAADIVENGQEALNRIIEHQASDPYDLIIADLTVKGGFGANRLLKKVNELDNPIDIMVYSGYYNTPEMMNPEKYGFVDSIKKPFRIDILKEKLQNLLT